MIKVLKCKFIIAQILILQQPHEGHSSKAMSNEIRSIVTSVMTNLKKAGNATNSRLGYSPYYSVEVPLDRKTFWSYFCKVIPKNISKLQLNIKCRISAQDFNSVLGSECDKFVKNDSDCQVRIFGPVDLHLYQKKIVPASGCSTRYNSLEMLYGNFY